MKTEELIRTFQALDVHKRDVDVQFITPNHKILDIDNVSLLSSISAANDTPKLTFYVYLKEMQHDGQDTRDTTGKSALHQKAPKNSECEKQPTKRRESSDHAAVVPPRRFVPIFHE